MGTCGEKLFGNFRVSSVLLPNYRPLPGRRHHPPSRVREERINELEAVIERSVSLAEQAQVLTKENDALRVELHERTEQLRNLQLMAPLREVGREGASGDQSDEVQELYRLSVEQNEARCDCEGPLLDRSPNNSNPCNEYSCGGRQRLWQNTQQICEPRSLARRSLDRPPDHTPKVLEQYS